MQIKKVTIQSKKDSIFERSAFFTNACWEQCSVDCFIICIEQCDIVGCWDPYLWYDTHAAHDMMIHNSAFAFHQE